jgi:ribonuclease PH
VGVVSGERLLDLCYEEDSRASVDMNLVMSGREALIEVQGTAEGAPFPRTTLNELIDLGVVGVRQMVAAQREVLADVVRL